MPENKRTEHIADMNHDFAQWYTDIVRKAQLAEYAETGGCIIFLPNGLAIWELIKSAVDARLRATGHENVYMPMLIPERLLQMESDHIEGFAPEVAWVTHGGAEKLQERLCIRPTSEVLFASHYKNAIQSYRDLPKLYNQWCSVMRWEKTTRPFLRTREFLWQEGHTAHATPEEALAEAMLILDIYCDVCENVLAMPYIKGRKSEREKFAGAKATFSFESLMHDGKALQSGTTHDFGDNFSRVFGVQFLDRDNKLKHVFQSSWGVSTRLIGALIMVHGDNNGLVLPPGVAPTQVVIVPVANHKPGVNDAAARLCEKLTADGIRASVDMSDHKPGWKFAEHEMRGVPLRIELGPRDIEQGQCIFASRDTGEKSTVSLDGAAAAAKAALASVHSNLLKKASERMAKKTFHATGMAELGSILDTTPGFVKTMWCQDEACELEVKNAYAATSRCVPFEQERISNTCVVCQKPTDTMVVWARAY